MIPVIPVLRQQIPESLGKKLTNRDSWSEQAALVPPCTSRHSYVLYSRRSPADTKQDVSIMSAIRRNDRDRKVNFETTLFIEVFTPLR